MWGFKLNVFIILIVGLIYTLGGDVVMARALEVECRSDTNCEEGMFCYWKTWSCVKCLNCRRFQLEPSRSKCAKGKDECGDCLPGFKMVAGVYCLSILTPTTSSPSPVTKKSADIYNWKWIAVPISILFLFAISAIVLFTNRYFKKLSQIQTSRTSQEAKILIPTTDHQNFNSRDNNRLGSTASAPPEEYFVPQPAYFNQWNLISQASPLPAPVPLPVDNTNFYESGPIMNILYIYKWLKSRKFYNRVNLGNWIIEPCCGLNEDEDEDQDQVAPNNFVMVNQNADFTVPVNEQIIETEDIQIDNPAGETNPINAEAEFDSGSETEDQLRLPLIEVSGDLTKSSPQNLSRPPKLTSRNSSGVSIADLINDSGHSTSTSTENLLSIDADEDNESFVNIRNGGTVQFRQSSQSESNPQPAVEAHSNMSSNLGANWFEATATTLNMMESQLVDEGYVPEFIDPDAQLPVQNIQMQEFGIEIDLDNNDSMYK